MQIREFSIENKYLRMAELDDFSVTNILFLLDYRK